MIMIKRNVINYAIYRFHILLPDVEISNSTYHLNASELLRVTSPNYPNNYSDGENIFWHVQAPGSPSLMFIAFESVHVESCCDYIRLYTGTSDLFEESTLILTLKEEPIFDSFWSYYLTAHPNMWLQFTTDRSGTDQGFLAFIQGLPDWGKEVMLFHVMKY